MLKKMKCIRHSDQKLRYISSLGSTVLLTVLSASSCRWDLLGTGRREAGREGEIYR